MKPGLFLKFPPPSHATQTESDRSFFDLVHSALLRQVKQERSPSPYESIAYLHYPLTPLLAWVRHGPRPPPQRRKILFLPVGLPRPRILRRHFFRHIRTDFP